MPEAATAGGGQAGAETGYNITSLGEAGQLLFGDMQHVIFREDLLDRCLTSALFYTISFAFARKFF